MQAGLTALMEASTNGHVEVARVLVEKNADVNCAPVPGSREVPLTLAAQHGHPSLVQFLCKAGANLETRNKKGSTAFWLAASGTSSLFPSPLDSPLLASPPLYSPLLASPPLYAPLASLFSPRLPGPSLPAVPSMSFAWMQWMICYFILNNHIFDGISLVSLFLL